MDAASTDGKSVMVEKTPRHIRALPLIRRLAPQAKLILMARDGRDAAASIGWRYNGDYSGGHDRWVSDNTLLVGALSDPLAYLLRYEDLIDNPARELRGLVQFLGLRFEPAMMEYHQRQHLWFGKGEVQQADGVGKKHEDLRNWQVNQPIFDGRGRWKTDLPADVLAQFSVEPAKALMQRLGYGEGARPGRLSGPRGSRMDRLRHLLKQWRRAIGQRLRRR